MKNIHLFIVISILFVGFMVRLYKIDNPIADWHSWRQADTAAVTRNFDKFGFNPFVPRYDDLSNIQSGKDNPQGYRFVEFPLYQSIVYILSKLFSFLPFSIEIWHRIVSIFASLGSIYLLYLLGSRFANQRVGLFAALFFAILPYSVFYSRVILPEVFLVFFTLVTLYLFSKAKDQKLQYSYLLLSAICGACAVLIKPVALFFFLPIAYLIFQRKLFSIKNVVAGLLFGVIILSPLIVWRLWMKQFPEGIPDWKWLLNSDGIRFKGAFFRWLFAERLSKLILGYTGIWFLVNGILAREQVKEKLFFHLLGIGSLIYLSILATGNVKHDYYQVILLPGIVFYLGIGLDYVIQQTKKSFSPLLTYGVVGSMVLFMLAFSWYELQGYYWINNPNIVEAGKVANSLLPANAKVIAPYGGDTAFLYQTNRQGWPIGFEIEDKIKKGATHYVSVTPQDPEVLDLKMRYSVLVESDSYVIISLR